MGQRFNIGGMTVEVDDENPTESESTIVIPLTRTPPLRGKGTSGRSRFHALCPLHGPSASGDPCAKFSHLPGNGRGIKQPNFFVGIFVFFRAMIKPAMILAFVGGTLYLALHVLGGITDGLVPESPFGTVPPVTSVATTPEIDAACFVPANPCKLAMP